MTFLNQKMCFEIEKSSPLIEGLHGKVLQDESTADHEGGSSQADGTCASKIEAVCLVAPGAALDEVNHNHRGGCIQGAVHGAHCCSQDTRDDHPGNTCTSPLLFKSGHNNNNSNDNNNNNNKFAFQLVMS